MTSLIFALNAKNEQAVIGRCIRAAHEAAPGSQFLVIDTGSTDDTVAEAWKAADELGAKLTVLENPWENYAANQTFLLEQARRLCPDGYTWILDADEVVQDPGDITIGDADAYTICRLLGKDNDWENWCIRIFSNKRAWKYEGERHAYPVVKSDDLGMRVTKRIPIDVLNHRDGASGTDDAEKQRQRFDRDVEIFSQQSGTRAAYYLAQSLQDAGRHEEAIQAYERRAFMTGSRDEQYLSALKLAQYSRANRLPSSRVESWFHFAIAIDPQRLDALVELAIWHNDRGERDLAKLWAHKAVAIEEPSGSFLTRRSYRTWRRTFEVWRATESEAVARVLLQNPHIPAPERLFVEQWLNRKTSS